MSKTNSKLAGKIGQMKPKSNLVAAQTLPKPDTTNIQGKAAYKQDKWLQLVTLLNTSKFEAQYYRSSTDTVKRLQSLVTECAKEDLYLTCQCIVYSRCIGEGMRTVNQAAAVFIAPHLSGAEFSKRFYGPWNKKEQKGGVIFRPDDMSEILQGYIAVNGNVETTTISNSKGTTVSHKLSGPKLSNAMKKGFKTTLETLDNYSLLKYKSKLIDIINLVHPNPKINSKQVVELEDGKKVYTLDAIIQGLPIKANTWETNQSEAGQIVAKAVREGKITQEEAKEVLKEAKSDNWKELLDTDKLGILAALRNIRNILSNKPSSETITKLCSLLSNPTKIREGKILPAQIDLANEIIIEEFNSPFVRQIAQALLEGYYLAIPNLKEALPGMNLIMVDRSGSMGWAGYTYEGPQRKTSQNKTVYKAALIAATIAKATGADIIYFGTSASYHKYNANTDVFTLAKELAKADQGSTNLSAAWQLAAQSGNNYDRVFILSDNEVNRGSTYDKYKNYLEKVGDPYVYSVDLAAYGTNAIAGNKVRFYYGYGMSLYDDIAKSEFNAYDHLEKIRKVVI